MEGVIRKQRPSVMAGEIIRNLLYPSSSTGWSKKADLDTRHTRRVSAFLDHPVISFKHCLQWRQHAFSFEGSLLGRETHSNHVKLRQHASYAVISIPCDSVFAFRISADAGEMGWAHGIVRVRNAYVRMIPGATENAGVENSIPAKLKGCKMQEWALWIANLRINWDSCEHKFPDRPNGGHISHVNNSLTLSLFTFLVCLIWPRLVFCPMIYFYMWHFVI